MIKLLGYLMMTQTELDLLVTQAKLEGINELMLKATQSSWMTPQDSTNLATWVHPAHLEKGH